MLCSVLLFYIQYRTFIRESEEEGRNIFIVMFVPERSERNGKNDDDSYIVQYIRDHTPENAVVFLTGIGKCYPILRSHKVLNNLHQAFVRVPVVMFFPGTYDEQELVLFNEIKDDNYYRAFRLVK